jgi:AcrR family transcriptional regulator
MTVRTITSPARTRQQRTHQRIRREILLSASGVFARHGYAAATLTDLAEAAGYAPPSLYRYFKSKEEIFSSLIELLKGELHATFELPVDRALALPGRLESLLRAQFELTRERREIFDVLLDNRPPAGSHPTPLPDLRAGMAHYEADMSDWLRRHASRRELRCPFELAARALAGISHAFHNGNGVGTDQGTAAEQARLVVDLALHGLKAAGPTSSRVVEP